MKPFTSALDEEQSTAEPAPPKPPHRALFGPCADEEHSDCIGYSNGLRRDAELVVCVCECHDVERRSRKRGGGVDVSV
jgi:hypothetical protein